MTTFLLLPGSWTGGWLWQRVRPLLDAHGHRVLTPSLTGLGDRAHLAGPDVGLAVHVADIVNLLRYEDLEDVVLVGHSYGGMVITGVAAEAADHLGHLVYLDAFAPTAGQSAFDQIPWLEEAFGSGPPDRPWAVPPLGFDALGVTDPGDLAWLSAKATAMPKATHSDRLPAGSEGPLTALPITYVHCTGQPLFDEIAAEVSSRGIEVLTLPTGHMPMVTHPELLARCLLGIGDRSGVEVMSDGA